MKYLYPVIHFLNTETALENARIAFDAGCEGLFIIDMTPPPDGQEYDPTLYEECVKALVAAWPDKNIGINYLETPYNILENQKLGATMEWCDNPGIHSNAAFNHRVLQDDLNQLANDARQINPDFKFFGSVAFKTQIPDFAPGESAVVAANYGWIATTSGVETGSPPSVEKMKTMKEALGDRPLAVASGIDPENVLDFLSYVDYFLVATGISKSFYEFDPTLVEELIRKIQ